MMTFLVATGRMIHEQCLKKESVENEIENNRRHKSLDRAFANAKTRKDKLPFFHTKPKRPTQLSVKFIRWLRNISYTNTSWIVARGALKRIYAVFLIPIFGHHCFFGMK